MTSITVMQSNNTAFICAQSHKLTQNSHENYSLAWDGHSTAGGPYAIPCINEK